MDVQDYQYRQYLAIAPFPTRTHSPMIGSRVRRPNPACIQIWSLGPANAEDAMDVDAEGSVTEEQGIESEMRCEMVLCVESGPAYELKWCPLPSNDDSTTVYALSSCGAVAHTVVWIIESTTKARSFGRHV